MIRLTTESFHEDKNRHDLTHWHNNIELIRVTAGNLNCVVNGESHKLRENDICIINSQQLHMIYCAESRANEKTAFQRLMIDPAVFTSNKPLYQKYIVPMLTDQTFAHVKVEKRDSALFSNIINRMAEINEEQAIGYELETVAMVYLLFQHLFILYQKEKGKTVVPSNADRVLYKKMADFIYQNYRNKITLADIAAAGNVSKSKCGSVFKEYAGHTPIDFLNVYRLNVSADLLRATDKSVAEIAFSCGFEQQSYFNRLFLREYGVTPKEYRKNG